MAEGEFVYKPDLNRTHPPIDETVKMPRQVRLAVERAEDLIAGRQPRPIGVPAASAPSGSASKPTDAQINAALAWLEANVNSSNPDSTVALEIFRQGERIIKARRRGAQKPRKASTLVTQRLEALFQAFRELPPKFRQHPTGVKTIERLRKATLQKLGLPDKDSVLSEDTIRQDIRQLRPLLRVVQEGRMPPPGLPSRS